VTQYGYRLYAVRLHENQSPTSQPFTAAQKKSRRKNNTNPIVDYRDLAVADVLSAAGTTFPFGGATDGEDDEPAETKGSAMRFVNASRVGSNVRLLLHHGLTVAEGISVDTRSRGSDDVPLTGRATLLPYRAALIARPNQMTAIVVAEVRGRTSPITSVIRGLHKASSDHWKLKASENVAARAAVTDFIRNGEANTAHFEQWAYDDDGQRQRRLVSLDVSLRDHELSVRERVVGWAERHFEKRTKLRGDEEAGALKTTLLGSRVDIDFDEVGVAMKSGGVSKTLKPSSNFGRFTYPLGERRPSDGELYAHGESSAEALLDLVQSID